MRDDRRAPDENRRPDHSMDWLHSLLSEEAINKELDARQRIEEAMRERRC
jgi:hypothetical protein